MPLGCRASLSRCIRWSLRLSQWMLRFRLTSDVSCSLRHLLRKLIPLPDAPSVHWMIIILYWSASQTVRLLNQRVLGQLPPIPLRGLSSWSSLFLLWDWPSQASEMEKHQKSMNKPCGPLFEQAGASALIRSLVIGWRGYTARSQGFSPLLSGR